MNNKLLIFTEVDYYPESESFRNSSVNIIFLEYSKFFDEIHVYCPGEKNGEYSFSSNIKVHTTSTYSKKISSRVYFLLSTKERLRIRNIIKSNSIGFVQVRVPSIFSFITFFLINRKKINVSYYIAGDWNSSFLANFSFPGSSLVARGLKRISHIQVNNSKVITAGATLAKEYAQNGVKAHAYLSTTHKKYITSELKNWKQICCVGRLEPLKRVSDVIDAVKLLNNAGHNYRLQVCGDGKDENYLKNLVISHGLEDVVTFHGNISNREKMADIYINSGFMVIASISEGTPKVIPESMSYGCIPIAIDGVGSINSIITDKENGLLVKKNSPESIAEAILSIESDEVLKFHILKKAKDYSVEHTIDNEVKKLWHFIKNGDNNGKDSINY